MAEVHEITRKAFEQICEDGYATRDTWMDKPDYVVVSCWAEFGKMGVPIIRAKHTNDEALPYAERLSAVNLHIAQLGETCIDEFEVWHIVDDAESEPEPETDYVAVFGSLGHYFFDDGDGKFLGLYEVKQLKYSAYRWVGVEDDSYGDLEGWAISEMTGCYSLCKVVRLANGHLQVQTVYGEPVARLVRCKNAAEHETENAAENAAEHAAEHETENAAEHETEHAAEHAAEYLLWVWWHGIEGIQHMTAWYETRADAIAAGKQIWRLPSVEEIQLIRDGRLLRKWPHFFTM